MVRLGKGSITLTLTLTSNPKLNPKHSPYLLSYWEQISSKKCRFVAGWPGARALANPTVAPIDLSQLVLSLRRSLEDGPLLQR